MTLIHIFSKALGLFANMEKLELYLVGLENPKGKELAELMGFPICNLPYRFLGVPLSHKKLTVA